jgi:hypothetical protein
MSTQAAQAMEAIRLYRKTLKEAQNKFTNTIKGSLECILLAAHADSFFKVLVDAGVPVSETNKLVNAGILKAIKLKRHPQRGRDDAKKTK